MNASMLLTVRRILNPHNIHSMAIPLSCHSCWGAWGGLAFIDQVAPWGVFYATLVTLIIIIVTTVILISIMIKTNIHNNIVTLI